MLKVIKRRVALIRAWYLKVVFRIPHCILYNSMGDITFIAIMSKPYYVLENGTHVRARLVETILYSEHANVKEGSVIPDYFTSTTKPQLPNSEA